MDALIGLILLVALPAGGYLLLGWGGVVAAIPILGVLMLFGWLDEWRERRESLQEQDPLVSGFAPGPERIIDAEFESMPTSDPSFRARTPNESHRSWVWPILKWTLGLPIMILIGIARPVLANFVGSMLGGGKYMIFWGQAPSPRGHLRYTPR